MVRDPIRGKTLRFHFVDGVMANKTFEHRFADDGSVTFHMVPNGGGGKDTPTKEPIRYTLTTVLDLKSKKLVSFSSDAKTVAVQHGTFDETAEG